MSSHFQVSAPGKVILHGEHSVVHGKKAIACAIGSRITISVSSSSSSTQSGVVTFLMPSLSTDEIIISVDDFMKICQDETQESLKIIQQFCSDKYGSMTNQFVSLALSCCLYGYYKVFFASEVRPSIKMSIESELPIGAGLGSSGAFNTCIACSYLIISKTISQPCENTSDFHVIENEEELSKINSLAYELEAIVHSTPSGIDNSIATHGGAVSFQNGSLLRIKRMPELKLLIVDTGVARSTKTLVANVREFKNKFPKVVEPILEAMHNIAITSENLLDALYTEKNRVDYLKDLGSLIVTNQCLLSSIGVSHPSLDKICSISTKHGFPAKLTGAGGGGCAIVLLSACESDEKINPLLEELTAQNFVSRMAVLGGPGIMVKYS